MPITIGPKKKIYRGGAENNDPQQKELLANAAGLLPGQVVTDQAGSFGLPAAGVAPYFYIVNAPMHQNPLNYVYADDESVAAYIPRSRDVYLCRAAAGTYASDAPLSVNALGQVVALTGTNSLIGYAWSATGEPVTVTAGQFIDVRIK